MFILYAVAVGLVAGIALGGRPAGLADLRIRWSALIAIGLAAQVLLFSSAVAERVGDAGPLLYVGSTLLVVAAVARNAAIRGMPVVIAGALCNLLAVVANGGYMPASRAALEASGKVASTAYTNSSLVPDPALWPLTDIFALPSWMPLANVFSVGDVLIGVGIALVAVLAMRRGRCAVALTRALSGTGPPGHGSAPYGSVGSP
jgi:Family of unknown function (DUF5317)